MEAMGHKQGILIVEDEAIVAHDIEDLVNDMGLEVAGHAVSGLQALDKAREGRPDLVLMDIRLAGDMNGFETAARMNQELELPVIFVTAFADDSSYVDNSRYQPYGWLIKPFTEVEFKTTIFTALNRIAIEKRLREREEMFRRLAQFAPIGISIMAPDKRFMYFNPRFTEILGYTLEDIPDKDTWFEKAYPKELRDEVIKTWNKDTDGGRSVGEVRSRVFPVRCKDGTEKIIAIRTVVTEKSLHVLTYEDITEQVLVEEELRLGKERLQTLFSAMPDSMAISDLEGAIVEVNDVFCEMSGYSRNELLGRRAMDLDLWADLSDRERMFGELNRKGYCRNLETRVRRADGVLLSVLISARIVEIDGATHLLSVTKDIHEWKKDKKALRESQELYSALTENAGDLIMRLDTEFTNHYLSPAVETILGYERNELIGRSNLEMVHEEDTGIWMDAHRNILAPGARGLTFTYRIRRKDGELIWLETSAKAIIDQETGLAKEIVAVARDVTARKNQQDRAIHAERLIAVGELAGGVAHNFNNVLQIVLGNTQLAMTNLELGAIGEAMDNLSQIMDSSKYASETIRRLQSFSGAPSSHSDSVAFDISGTVEQALNMTKVWWKTRPEAMGASIEVIPDLESDCYVKGKESEIFEVVVNLIKNASEAMPAGGSLSIGLKNDGTNVELKVSDSGMGVSEENQRKIFMPFFTTKGFESSGMGLASSHGIVANHGGEIVLNSKEGMGATFIVKLPLAQRPLEEKRAGFVSRLKKDLCVLVADDAAPVLDTITMALKQLNQTVLIAGDGREAVEIWQNNHVDVVICDLGMPELNGWEVGMKIMEGHSEQGRPKTPFILITGWEGQKLEKDKIRAAGVDCIIEKPVEINELVMAINSVLDEDCDSLASQGG